MNMGIYSCDFGTLNINDMDYDKMTIESLAQWCHETSGYKINKVDVESRIRHLVEQLNIPVVSSQRELLIAFMLWYNPQNQCTNTDWIDIEEIDDFLKSN